MVTIPEMAAQPAMVYKPCVFSAETALCFLRARIRGKMFRQRTFYLVWIKDQHCRNEHAKIHCHFLHVQQLSIHSQPCELENVLEAQLYKTTCTALQYSCAAKQCNQWDPFHRTRTKGCEQPVGKTPWVLCKWLCCQHSSDQGLVFSCMESGVPKIKLAPCKQTHLKMYESWGLQNKILDKSRNVNMVWKGQRGHILGLSPI